MKPSLLNISRTAVFALFSLLLVGLPLQASAAETLGTIMGIHGDVRLLRGGVSEAINPGSILMANDQLNTGANGWAQLSLTGKGILTLGNHSQLTIQAQSIPGQETSLTFGFLKGVMRWVTSKVRSDAPPVEVKTPVGTLGIRGTDFRLWLCEGDCSTQAGQQRPAGLFISVFNGGVIFSNQAGNLVLKAGEHGFSESPTSAPVMLDSSPAVSDQTLAPLVQAQQTDLKSIVQLVSVYGLDVSDVVETLVRLQPESSVDIVLEALSLGDTFTGEERQAYEQQILTAAINAGGDPAALLEATQGATAAGNFGAPGNAAPANLGGIGGGSAGGGGGSASAS